MPFFYVVHSTGDLIIYTLVSLGNMARLTRMKGIIKGLKLLFQTQSL